MSPSRPVTPQVLTHFASRKETRPMPSRLIRTLDVAVSFLIIILTIGTGAATAVLQA